MPSDETLNKHPTDKNAAWAAHRIGIVSNISIPKAHNMNLDLDV